MKIVKHYWFVAIALITMISFSSCESDEERGFDISGLYGKTWWGDMGFEDRYGEPLYLSLIHISEPTRLGGAIWDLKTDMENLFTVTSHSPQVLSQIMV